MDRQEKLDRIERLVSYSGLESRRAQEFLEKCGWNVDAAYRLYKTSVMDQRGYKVGQNSSGGRYSQSVPAKPGGIYHVSRPVTDFMDGMGPVLMGMGPATQSAHPHPAFREPHPAPIRGPVEKPRERIIPIQVETKPAVGRLERQSAVTTAPASIQPSRPANTTSQPPVSSPSKSQPVGRGGHSPPQTVGRGGHPPPDQPYGRLGHPPPAAVNHPPPQQLIDHPLPHPIQRDHPLPAGVKGDNFPHQSKGEHPQPRPQRVDHPPPNPIGHPPPQVRRADAPDSTPKLKRGISKISENAMLVDEARTNILQDISEDSHDHMYVQTFVLPDVTGYNEDFRAFLEKDLIETSTLVSLEQAGRLNWWAEMGVCQRLLPMATSGDGNCLLHAASLAMWGIHDRQLMLRKALNDTLTKKHYRTALYRRWRWQQTQANKQAGLIFSEEEWQTEWDNVLRLASATPRTLPGDMTRNNSCCDSMVTQSSSPSQPEADSPVVYESLEDFHVFVLAHVIQRPIIVVADTILKDASGEALAPIPFGGIYLPLECDSEVCYRSPLLLTYDAAHFSALVPMDNTSADKNPLPVAIPIVGPDLEPLPLLFSIDPGVHYNWTKNNSAIVIPPETRLNQLKLYLDMEKVPIHGSYLDCYSDDRNSTGSYESDDGTAGKDKKKDNKVSQQLQTVSKQFGSFGKSFGKKLKNLGKGNKEDKEARKGRKPSIGSGMTQSTKVPLTIAALGQEQENHFVWCSLLTNKRSPSHQKMVDNYLYDAGERFKKERELKRLKNNEILNRVHHTNDRVQCVTAGCNLYGSADTCYLCPKCFDEQKQQALHQEKEMYNSYPNRSSKNVNEAQKFGKSKFYDMADGVERVSVNDSIAKQVNNDVGAGRPLKVHIPAEGSTSSSENRKSSNPAQPRHRTPSPDYDNVDYNSYPKPNSNGTSSAMQTKANSSSAQSPKPKPKTDKGVGTKCRNPGCDFYGNKDMEHLCSACYKSKQHCQQQHQLKLV